MISLVLLLCALCELFLLRFSRCGRKAGLRLESEKACGTKVVEIFFL
jgi:hypothetical protein